MSKEELEIEVRFALVSSLLVDSLADLESFGLQRKSTPIISYWHPNVTLTIISDRSAISFNSPPEAKKRGF